MLLRLTTFGISLVIAVTVMTVSHALDISLSGDWSLTIDSSDLISGAGSNLTSSYESNTDQVALDIINSLGGSDSWRVDVNKSDISWNGALSISCRRTSSGSGGSVSGGTSYLEIMSTTQEFFTGTDDVIDIAVQYMLDSVSVSIPPGNYSTTIIYTVVDT